MKEPEKPPSDFRGAGYGLWLETRAPASKRVSNVIVWLLFMLGVGGLLGYTVFRALF